MKCIVCGERIEAGDDKVFVVGDEALHHDCCNLIEKGLLINQIKLETTS